MRLIVGNSRFMRRRYETDAYGLPNQNGLVIRSIFGIGSKRANAKRSLGAQIIPPEVKQQMLERILAMAGDQIVQRRIVEDLAVWDAGALQSLGN